MSRDGMWSLWLPTRKHWVLHSRECGMMMVPVPLQEWWWRVCLHRDIVQRLIPLSTPSQCLSHPESELLQNRIKFRRTVHRESKSLLPSLKILQHYSIVDCGLRSRKEKFAVTLMPTAFLLQQSREWKHRVDLYEYDWMLLAMLQWRSHSSTVVDRTADPNNTIQEQFQGSAWSNTSSKTISTLLLN